ncbi:MAG TPA: porin [Polyangiaceae bacterium]|nr:porin [Polyangiaceae bacterium]
MKFPALILTPTLTFFAFQAFAQDAPAAPPQTPAPDAPAVAPAPTPDAAPTATPIAPPQPVLPPPAAATAPPELVAPIPPIPTSNGVGKDGNPLAGWHNELFYLRDTDDNFRLYVQGRAQIDFYSYAGPGVADTTLKPTLFLRRIRPEITGEFFHSWWFSIAGDFGATALDNPKGTNETAAAKPGVVPTDTTGAYAGAQTARISAAPTDVFLNYRADPLLNVQVGQFDAPFMMENRTSDKYLSFMERSLAVRDVGVPTNKEIGAMVWGETPDKYWFYSAGLFNGDGQNRLNTDSSGDALIRTFVHPLASDKTELKDLQIGASFRYGDRDHRFTYYDYPGMSTQGNYTFWSPTYGGSEGTTHILPSGHQTGIAGELRVPISVVDVQSEFVYINNHTREVQEGYQSNLGASMRRGAISGYSYYAQVGVWLGKRDVTGLPGYENMPHVDFSKADPVDPPSSVELLAKWEQLHLKYDSASDAGTKDTKNADGDIKVNAFSLGLNYWASRHIRLTANYVLNMFPDSAPTSATSMGGPVQSSTNRAIAPGNTLAKTVNDDARDNAHVLHEFLLRAAVAL